VEIAYRGTTAQSVYNTLFNPRGSKPVSLTLSDGSKVWLNSESSLRYPTSFTGAERTVEISGEAYFEVKKNLLSPIPCIHRR
jgi:transmembrane sensor